MTLFLSVTNLRAWFFLIQVLFGIFFCCNIFVWCYWDIWENWVKHDLLYIPFLDNRLADLAVLLLLYRDTFSSFIILWIKPKLSLAPPRLPQRSLESLLAFAFFWQYLWFFRFCVCLYCYYPIYQTIGRVISQRYYSPATLLIAHSTILQDLLKFKIFFLVLFVKNDVFVLASTGM